MTDVPVRLPRGRHKLTREEVSESQLERIRVATINVVGTEGYAGTTVSKILSLASVSRETFYANFENKGAALNAAYRHESAVLRARIVGAQMALPADAAPLERVDSAVNLYLTRMTEHLPAARAVLVEMFAAGPESIALAVEARQQFVDLAVAILGFNTPEGRFTCEAYLAAVNGTAMQRALAGRSQEIVGLAPQFSALARSILQRNDELTGPAD